MWDMEDEQLTSSVTFRVTRKEKTILDELCKAAHLNRASVLRSLLTEWLHKYAVEVYDHPLDEYDENMRHTATLVWPDKHIEADEGACEPGDPQ